MNMCPLPFHNERKNNISMLVIHAMAHDAQEGIDSLQSYELSAHYVVDFDGTIFQCVDESKRAWHAGHSSWKGLDDINSRSIGIEVCHKDLGQTKYNSKQIKSLIKLCQSLIKKHSIRADLIVGHSDIAPTRKSDPGKAFPWKELADNGIGLWYGEQKSKITDPAKLLKKIGYDVSSKESLIASAYAFRRRFLPKTIPTTPVQELIENPYPIGDESILGGADFLDALQNIAKTYTNYGQYAKTYHKMSD